VTYALTTRGNELSGVFQALNDIATRWAAQDARRGKKAA
jgi:DNA-binding HxlR family transcriptional regulator